MEPEEEIHAPKVRIGVLSRSTSTSTTSAQAGVEMMVVPPSRVQSSRVSDSSIETIRQSLREMEAQLAVAQTTVAAETKAKYDLHENTAGSHSTRMNHPESKVVVPTHTSKQKEDDEDKENTFPADQDIKRVPDDLQWAGT